MQMFVKILFTITFSILCLACSKKSDSTENQDDSQTVYNDLNYVITNEGIGNINLTGSFELVESNLPVAEMDTVFEEDDGSGLYLIRLVERNEYNLSVQVVNGDIIAISVFTAPFATERGISPQNSNLADLKNYYTVEDLWVPTTGVLHVGVKELPHITFVFEERSLMTLTEGAELVLADLPGGLRLTKIELYKALE